MTSFAGSRPVCPTQKSHVATVKAHVSSILTELDLNNRTQIALLAHDAGPTR
jgi:DNA-binding NarL/FixJ family response regulator